MATMPSHLRSVVDHDGAVILDSSRNAMTILDATGAYIWERLNRGVPFDAIVAELARDTGVDEQMVAKDVDAFMEQRTSRDGFTSALAKQKWSCDMDDHTEYRLAFILPESRQLLGIQNSGNVELPRISVPMWQRPAEQLTRLIEETWNIRTLVLDLLCDSPISTPCAVIEVRSSSWQFTRRGLTTVPLGNMGRLSLSGDERAALLSILSGSGTSRSPFARIGWIDEAQEWIRTAIRDHEVIFTDEMRHLNAGGEFCLLRLGTIAGHAYWLKAVGGPNAHEFGVTAYLAAVCPEYLPPILAIRADWRA